MIDGVRAITSFVLALSMAAAASTSAVCAAPPVQTSTIYFQSEPGTDNGSVEAIMPLSHLGSVPLPRGRVMIRGNTAEISEIPEWQFDRHHALLGTVLDTHVIRNAATSTIFGTIFFNDGEWLHYYDDPTSVETVHMANRALSGHVDSIDNSMLTLSTPGGIREAIPLSSVTAIDSPRAFRFSIAAAALVPSGDGDLLEARANTIALTPTAPAFHLSVLRRRVKHEMESGDISTNKLIVAATMLSLVELGQLAPFIITPLVSSHVQHQTARREFYSLTQGENSPKANFTNLLLPP